MHQIALSPEAVAFARAQRGGAEHMFERIDLSRTAHVCIDMQHGFVAPGAPVEVPVAKEIVPAINAISAAIRAGGGTNVFLRMTVTPESLGSWSNWFAHFHTPASTATFAEVFAPGGRYHGLWDALEVQSSDLIVNKTRFGAFVPGASELDAVLKARGIDTLIVTGTLTNCCCESTARDAMQMNYKLIFVSDANAAMSDAAHNATLDNMCMLFADVRSAAETVAVIEASAPHAVAAE
jgi:ureidoacrylate peracid hydrolase